MRRRLAILAAVSVFALALSASPALADSHGDGHDSHHVVHYDVTRTSDPAAGFIMACGSNTYEAISGAAETVLGVGTSASSDVPFFETITLRHVKVRNVDTGKVYRVVGGTQISGVGVLPDGPFVRYDFVEKIQIVGTHDGVDYVAHLKRDGTYEVRQSGTCPIE